MRQGKRLSWLLLNNFFLFFLECCYFKIFIYFYFWLCWVLIVRGLPLAAVIGGYSLLVVCGLLIVVASLVAEHGLLGHTGFSSYGA